MATDMINLVEATQLRHDIPKFGSGDTVNVHVRVIEGEKERIQQYQGVVIALKGSGTKRTFTVRKVSNGVGVERIFPIFFPESLKLKSFAREVFEEPSSITCGTDEESRRASKKAGDKSSA